MPGMQLVPANYNPAMTCPQCGDEYLHQHRIEVFNRGEDAKEGTHMTIQGETVKVDRDITLNPSARRQGISIYFECEHCPRIAVKLDIIQHKGCTYFEVCSIPLRETFVEAF